MESSNFINYLTDMCWRCSWSRMYGIKSTLWTVVTRTGAGFEDFGLVAFWLPTQKRKRCRVFRAKSPIFLQITWRRFLLLSGAVSEIRSWCKSRIARSETRSFGIQLDVGFRFSSSSCWSAVTPVRCIFAEFFLSFIHPQQVPEYLYKLFQQCWASQQNSFASAIDRLENMFALVAVGCGLSTRPEISFSWPLATKLDDEGEKEQVVVQRPLSTLCKVVLPFCRLGSSSAKYISGSENCKPDSSFHFVHKSLYVFSLRCWLLSFVEHTKSDLRRM